MPATLSRWGMPALLSLLVVISVAACASVEKTTGIKPVQSPNDDLSYRFLTLDNQLQVLLISDPDTPKAAPRSRASSW